MAVKKNYTFEDVERSRKLYVLSAAIAPYLINIAWEQGVHPSDVQRILNFIERLYEIAPLPSDDSDVH
jgi:hypothetical protein